MYIEPYKFADEWLQKAGERTLGKTPDFVGFARIYTSANNLPSLRDRQNEGIDMIQGLMRNLDGFVAVKVYTGKELNDLYDAEWAGAQVSQRFYIFAA